MNCSIYLSIIGVTLNIIGSILLAISLNKIIKVYNSSITALEHFKNTFLGGNDMVSFVGLDQQRKNALSNNNILNQIGLLLLIVGFILQLISIIMNTSN
ncbi:hypothetical protein [Yeosuana sp.]|uniref:hypothetical protein n=1 Tax=Yeosuana sp. TaxID=2529388 RepID=UPI004054AD93